MKYVFSHHLLLTCREMEILMKILCVSLAFPLESIYNEAMH